MSNEYSSFCHPLVRSVPSKGFYVTFRILHHHPDLERYPRLVTFLMDLLNIGASRDDGVKDGWFKCTESQMASGSKWRKSTQRWYLDKLVWMGLVSVRRQGNPPYRHVRIMLDRLADMVDEAEDMVNGRPIPLMTSGIFRQRLADQNAPSIERVKEPIKTAARKLAAGVEEPKVLFDVGPDSTSKQPKYTPYDLEVAKRLRKAVVTRYRKLISTPMVKWADQIRKLRTDLQGDTKRIDLAIRWLEGQTDPKAFPHVSSAEMFRRNFLLVESAMSSKPKGGPPPVEVSSRAQEIADRLTRHNHWPKGSAGQVPQVVEQSIRNVQAVWKRCRTLVESGSPTDQKDLVGMAYLILSWIKVTSPVDRVEKHLERVSQQVSGWEGWSGNLCQFVWRLDQKTVLQQVMEMGTEYCGSAKFTKWWDSVKDELLEGL